MFAVDDLNALLARLHFTELVALWTAVHEGYLVAAYPSKPLIELHVTISFLEHRPTLILQPRAGQLWKFVAGVHDLGALPAFAQRLTDTGVWIRRILPETGVINAAVGSDRAEAVAKSLVPAGVRRSRGLWE